MSLFKRSEVKKTWTEVIKNDSSPDFLIYKYPSEDFNTNSTLIVQPGEEAIFIDGGIIKQVFSNGTYKLSTKNYPFITSLRNLFSGGVSIFNCRVYFVRTTHSVEIKWGTDSPIQVRDKLLGIATKIKCRGAYKVQIKNPQLFLEKLIGNNMDFETEVGLNKYFISQFQSKIKSVIARALLESNMELLGIDARLDEFSEIIEPYMDDILKEYGLTCVRFVVSALDLEDDELRRKYDEVGIETIAKLRHAQADKAVFETLGDNWQRQRQAEILKAAAENEGSGGGAGIGVGLGAGLGMFNAMQNNNSNNMGLDKPKGNDDVASKLQTLKTLFDQGLIDKDEYDAKRKELLAKL